MRAGPGRAGPEIVDFGYPNGPFPPRSLLEKTGGKAPTFSRRHWEGKGRLYPTNRRFPDLKIRSGGPLGQFGLAALGQLDAALGRRPWLLRARGAPGKKTWLASGLQPYEFIGLVATALEIQVIILDLTILSRFPTKLVTGTRCIGSSSKNGVECAQNSPRRPIIRPFRDHVLVRSDQL